jgi:hypothetical protein
MFLTPDDFTGQYKVSTNSYIEVDFQLYINKLEQKYLTDLLGVALYDLFEADVVSGSPVTQIYIDIFDAFAEDDGTGSGCQHRSNGMVEMLKGFIYFHFMRDLWTQSTMNGQIKNEFSNSTQARMSETNLDENYNEAVKTYQEIQWYIKENLDVYPTFNGMEKLPTSWL